jgi:aryl-alcohol dehydrogenase-like predicted oxidoreductase
LEEKGREKMQYFEPLPGKAKWSRIAMGCWQIAPSDGWGEGPPADQAEAAVKQALDCGITTFDTAEGYGDGESERRLGKALGPKKNDVAIISKIWPDAELAYPAFLARLDQTLANLGRDYVDLYLFHFPSGRLPGSRENEIFCQIMAKLKETEKARLVGISNFGADDVQRLGERAGLFSFNEVCYNLLEREYEGDSLKACRAHGIEYLAYSPLAQGLLTGRFDKKTPITDRVRKNNALFSEPRLSKALKVVEALRQVADETKATITQIALAWTLEQENIAVAIVGSHKPEQIREAAAAGDVKLTGEQIAKLTQASDAFKGRSP